MASYAAIGLWILALLLVLGFAWLGHQRSREREEAGADKRFRELIAGLQADGQPVTVTELAPPPIPDEENGAFLLQAAAGDLAESEKAPGCEKAWVWFREKWDGNAGSLRDQLPRAQAVLSFHASTLRLLEEALARPRFRFPLAYGDGLKMKIPFLSGFTSLKDLLKIRALVRACRGQGVEAVEDVDRILRLGEAMQTGRALILFLVSLSVHAEAGATFECVLRLVSPPPGALRTLEKRFTSASKALDFKSALIAHRAFSMDSFTLILSGKSMDYPQDPGGPGPPFLMKKEAVDLLKRFQRCLNACDKPYPLARLILQKACSYPQRSALSGLLLPVFVDTFDAWNRYRAKMRMCALACRITADRLEGHWNPEKPFDPQSKAALDPFTGKPFGARGGTEAVLLWSPGPDGKDAGIKPLAFRNDEPEEKWDDIFFYIPLPAPPTREAQGEESGGTDGK